MTRGKLFIVCMLALAFVFASTAMAVEKAFDSKIPVINAKASLMNQVRSSDLRRDGDEYTFRYVKSTDGGETWSDFMDAGDLGTEPSYVDHGVVVDASNGLHIISPQDYAEGADYATGVYHVMVDADGNNSMEMVYEASDEMTITWCDAGINGDGAVYAMWYAVVSPEEGDAWGGIWVAMSMEDGWSDAFLVTDAANPESAAYPHMTSMVGDYLYIIHQKPNAESGLYDQYILGVPASLEGDVMMSEDPVASSGSEVSYYIDAVDPIAQDVENGYIYFVIRSEDLTGVTIGNSSDGGESWTLEAVTAAQRYPSIRLDVANMTPYVFSNYGVPSYEDPDTSAMHYSWFVMDEGGYGGGLWTEPTDYMTVTYPGELLYVANGAFTSEGRMIAGCNIWSYGSSVYPTSTPWGYGLVYSDDMEAWSDQMVLYNGIEDDFLLSTLAHGSVYAGTDNVVYYTWAATAGENDLVAPVIRDWVTLSSTEPGQPWEVSCYVSDDVGVIYSDINWAIVHPDSADNEFDWTDGYESVDVVDEATMSGLYHYVMPSDTMLGKPVDEVEMVWFYIFAMDQTNTVEGPTFTFVPGEEWMSVPNEDFVPMEIGLASNYPNPFNNSTMIPFSVDRATDVKVAVYDVNGRLIDTLYEGNVQAGQHTVAWHAQNVVSGVYFYSLEVNGSKFTRKMTLVH